MCLSSNLDKFCSNALSNSSAGPFNSLNDFNDKYNSVAAPFTPSDQLGAASAS